MKAKPFIARAQATQDIEAAIDHYLSENTADAAMGFVDALEQAYRHLGLHSATGSPRYGHALGIPSLRTWPITRSPFLVFFVEAADYIDVWRVLHTRRDIPSECWS